jgi:predicted membrane protein
MTFSIFNDIKRVARRSSLEADTVTSIFGDAEIDLTKAPLALGDHTFHANSIFGDLVIRVSDQVGIDLDVKTVFGDTVIEELLTGEREKPGGSWVSETITTAPIRISIQAVTVFGDVKLIRIPSFAINPEARGEEQHYIEDSNPAYIGNTTKLDGVERRD